VASIEANAIRLLRYPKPVATQPNWLAVNLQPNRENHLADQLARCSVKHLPLHQTDQRWKNRSVELTVPLFCGYLFARLPRMNRLQTLATPSTSGKIGVDAGKQDSAPISGPEKLHG